MKIKVINRKKERKKEGETIPGLELHRDSASQSFIRTPGCANTTQRRTAVTPSMAPLLPPSLPLYKDPSTSSTSSSSSSNRRRLLYGVCSRNVQTNALEARYTGMVSPASCGLSSAVATLRKGSRRWLGATKAASLLMKRRSLSGEEENVR